MNFSHLPTLNLQSLKATTTPAGRMYHTPDGDMPSITTVLSRLNRQGIMEWRKRVGEEEANKISGKASSRGTRIHKLCDCLLYTSPRPRDEE